MGACVALGQGVLALIVLSVGLWPFPFRFTLDERGLRVSWFVLREWIPWSQTVRAEVESDSRRWVLGRRPRVLRIHRCGGKPVTLSGPPAALEKLCAAISVVVSAR